MYKGGSLSATYNENGKLIRVIEKYKDVKLPLLLFILYTNTQVGKLLMTGICTQKRGDILKKQYNLKNQKRKKTSVN
jgi:hypothetical protein